MKNYANEITEMISKYGGEIVSDGEYEEIECSSIVKSIENCGYSGHRTSKVWYVVTFVNGVEMSIYS